MPPPALPRRGGSRRDVLQRRGRRRLPDLQQPRPGPSPTACLDGGPEVRGGEHLRGTNFKSLFAIFPPTEAVTIIGVPLASAEVFPVLSGG